MGNINVGRLIDTIKNSKLGRILSGTKGKLVDILNSKIISKNQIIQIKLFFSKNKEYLDLDFIENFDDIKQHLINKILDFNGTINLNGLKSLNNSQIKNIIQRYETRKNQSKKLDIFLKGKIKILILTIIHLKYKLKNGNFDWINQIDQNIAEKLSEFSGNNLSLNRLKSIDKDVAEKLANFEGDTISLNGLNTIDKESVENLTKFRGDTISLNGLNIIDINCFEKILNFGGTIKLEGLTTIPSLTNIQINNFYDKVKNLKIILNDTLIKQLIIEKIKNQIQSNDGNFDWIENLFNDDKILDEIIKYNGIIKLNGIQKLTQSQINKILTRNKDRTKGKIELNEEAKKNIKFYEQKIQIIKKLRKGNKNFDWIDEINSSNIILLNRIKGKNIIGMFNKLSLNGLKKIDDKCFDILLNYKGKISLKGLTTLSNKQIKQIIERNKNKSKGKIILNKNLTKIIDQINESNILDFNFIKKLDENTANIISNIGGTNKILQLNGLKQINKGIVEILSKFNGIRIELNGLSTIDKESIENLIKFEGELFLDGVKKLNIETTKILSNSNENGYKLKGLSFLGIVSIKDNSILSELSKIKIDFFRIGIDNVSIFKNNETKTLDFPGIKIINDEIIKQILDFKSEKIILDGIIKIEEKQLEKLLDFRGIICLRGIISLPILSNEKNTILFDKIKNGTIILNEKLKIFYYDNMIDQQIKQLNRDFSWLKRFDKTVLKKLKKLNGGEIKFGITKLDDTLIELLIGLNCDYINLNKIESINLNQLKKLSKFKGSIVIQGISKIDDLETLNYEQKKFIMKNLYKFIFKDKITTQLIEIQVGKKDGNFDWIRNFEKDKTIEGIFDELIKFDKKGIFGKPKKLSLNGIFYIDDKSFETIMNYKGEISMLKLQDISEEKIQKFLEREPNFGKIQFNDFINQKIRIFKQKQFVSEINKKGSINENQAEKISKFEIDELNLDNIQIDYKIAKKLKNYKGNLLNLQGCKLVDQLLLKELVDIQCNSIKLGITKITNENFDIIKNFKCENLFLDNITKIDDEIINHLKTLKFPHIKHISFNGLVENEYKNKFKGSKLDNISFKKEEITIENTTSNGISTNSTNC